MTTVVLVALVIMLVSSIPATAAIAKVVKSGLRSSGAVALTFDDGHNSAACSSIAKTLRAYNAKGTFFINGNLLKLKPAR